MSVNVERPGHSSNRDLLDEMNKSESHGFSSNKSLPEIHKAKDIENSDIVIDTDRFS